mgnify:CR=1 FL=1
MYDYHHPYHTMPPMEPVRPGKQRLAPHETLELHERLAAKTFTLYNQKQTLPKITDPELRGIYQESNRLLETHIRQIANLLQNRM